MKVSFTMDDVASALSIVIQLRDMRDPEVDFKDPMCRCYWTMDKVHHECVWCKARALAEKMKLP